MSIPEQPFGFVAGRWVLSLADTPMDSDRAPDYKPLYPGSVIFNNKLSHRVVTDGSGTVGIVKTRIEAFLNEEGNLTDAEGHQFIALPVGVYSVTFSFGQYSWPNFDIEVKAEHTLNAPLWLPSKSPIPAGPGIVHVVSEEARLAAEAAAASAWAAVDTPGRQGPQGVPGPPGDLDAEHLAGAPRLTNDVHDITWDTRDATIDSQTPRLAKFTATARYGYIRKGAIQLNAGPVYYVSAEVKATSDQVRLGGPDWVHHSGSGDWERLAVRINLSSGSTHFMVGDTTPSGWAPVEVRDPVVINLTEVFGAGREPTTEYMDALMAKHGNYIGGVDQFGFGDALQALTVAGPGMGLHYDNSVGERVLLDHPGGTTMLHGDTGWRNVASIPTTGTPEFFNGIRRIGGQVTLTLMLSDVTLVAGGTLFAIPSGFLPAAGSSFRLHAMDTAGQLWRLSPWNLQTVEAKSNATVWLTVTWPTSQAWPTVLPETPL